jgi:Tfp pilus assembly protein PilO
MTHGSTEDITGVHDVENQPTFIKRASYWPPFVTVMVLLIATAVGVTVWATTEHSDIKAWTAEQDYVTKKELKDTFKEQYVPLHQFTKVEEALENQKDDLKDLKYKMDKVLQRLPDRRRNR